MNDKYLTASDLIKKLQVSRSTITRWEKNGTLKPIRVGGIKRYAPDTLEKLNNK